MSSSNIAFHSNVNIYNAGPVIVDTEFLSKVRDLDALKKMKARYGTNSREYYFRRGQLEIINNSHYCGYLGRDPCWGPVLVNGSIEMDCKCVNHGCEKFKLHRSLLGLKEFSFDPNDIERFSPEDRFLSDEYDYGRYKHELFFPVKTEVEELYTYTNEMVNAESKKADAAVAGINPFLNDSQIFAGFVNHEPDEIPWAEDDDYESGTGYPEPEDFAELQTNIFGSLKYVNQEEMILSGTDRNIFVDAGPGTGKTYVLIEKINFLVDKEDIDPQTIQVLSFTNSAVDEIKARLNEKVKNGGDRGLRNVDVRTFHSMAWLLLGFANDNYGNRGWQQIPLAQSEDYDKSVLDAADLIDRFPEIISRWQYFIVDEVQDLTGNKAIFVLSIIRACIDNNCGFLILGDSCQGIYDYTQDAITSRAFYYDLYKTIKGKAEFVSLKTNHRQSDQLIEITSHLRSAILEESAERMMNSVKVLDASINELDKTARNMNADYVRQQSKEKRLCFLCRNNGQTLRLSTLFRKIGISHVLNTTEVRDNFAPWIAYMFADYEDNAMTFDRFVNRMQKKGIDFKKSADPESVWNRIKRIMNAASETVDVLAFLSALKYAKIDDPIFRITPGNNVIVSTIHRSKGREYETVILDKSFINGLKSSEKDVGEYKTLYVAVTRPKETLKTCSLSFERIRKEKRTVRNRWCIWEQKQLKHLEINAEHDVSRMEFIKENAAEKQSYILNNVKPGDEIKLKRVTLKGRTGYEIYHCADEEDMLLGRLRGSFVNDLKLLTGAGRNIEYPSFIEDLYVESVYTHIASPDFIQAFEPIRNFSQFGVWNWINFRGLGHLKYDCY